MTTLSNTELREAIHLKMLSKSVSAKELGEMTAVPLGFAVDIALELFEQAQQQLLRDLIERKELYAHHNWEERNLEAVPVEVLKAYMKEGE